MDEPKDIEEGALVKLGLLEGEAAMTITKPGLNTRPRIVPPPTGILPTVSDIQRDGRSKFKHQKSVIGPSVLQLAFESRISISKQRCAKIATPIQEAVVQA